MSVDFHYPWVDSWLSHHLTTAGYLSYYSQGRYVSSHTLPLFLQCIFLLHPFLTGKSFLNNDRILEIGVILWPFFALVIEINDASYLGINSCLYLEIDDL